MPKPKIGITMGDAAGIGPEIIVKTLNEKKVYKWCSPIVLGDVKVMQIALRSTGLKLKIHPIKEISKAQFEHGTIDVFDFNNIDIDRLKMGRISEMCGKAAVVYTERAVKMAMNKQIHAIVSAPLNKESMRKAGYHYSSQTNIIGELTSSKNYSLMSIFNHLRVLTVTSHISLRKACELITKKKVLDTIILANSSMETLFGVTQPKIGISALNPHAGEGGIFGKEEIEEITPAIRKANSLGIKATGPIPADTVFVKAKRGEFDIVVALYHDQAFIPVKVLGFGKIVTVVAGVPVIRTSVAHGTAFDIAGKNLADHRNFLQAVKLAADLGEKFIKRDNRRRI